MNQKIKISQLPAKGSNLAAADLLEIAEFTGTGYISKSITGAEIAAGATAGFVPETRTLTINGTTQDLLADRTFTISTGITIGTTAITSGTVGRVLFEGTGNVVQESANLTWDNTNGIFNVVGRINAKSTTAQPSSLIVEGTTGVNSGNAGFVVRTGTGYQATFFAADSLAGQGIAGLGIFSGSATPFGLQTGAPNGAFFIHNNGNIGIGTSYTNAGFKLDVNGTARVQDNLTVSRNQNATTGLFISNTTNSASSTAAINLTSSNGEAAFAKKPALGSVYKIIAGNDAYIANGTAGDISMLNDFATGRIKFAAGGASTAQATLFSTGNFAINTTTDAGFRLDVNGTARFTGQFSSGASSNFQICQNSGNVNFQVRADGYVQFNNYTALSGSTMNVLDGSRISMFGGGPLSGNINQFSMSHLFQTNVNSHTYTGVLISTTINQTGGASGITRGLYVNPTLTAAADFRAIETTAGRVIFGGLPTSSAGLPTGAIWNDAGTLKIV